MKCGVMYRAGGVSISVSSVHLGGARRQPIIPSVMSLLQLLLKINWHGNKWRGNGCFVSREDSGEAVASACLKDFPL